MQQVLAAGEVLVDRRVLPGQSDERAHQGGLARRRRGRGRGRVPASGARMVVRMRTAVVLPAPFGPSKPKMVPSSTAKLTPSKARTSAP